MSEDIDFSRLGMAVGLLSFIVAIVVPTIRMKGLTGRSGYVANRPPSAVHKLALDGMRVAVAAAIGWAVAFIVLGPGPLEVWETSPLSVGIGWAFVLAGTALILIAQTQMGASWRIGIDAEARTELVTRGLFAFCRNPIFSGMLMVVLGIVAFAPSAWSVMGWAFVYLLIALQTRLEEEHLLRLHGDRYRAYASEVGRFVPGLGRLSRSGGKEVTSHG